jgi:hypothetical protein
MLFELPSPRGRGAERREQRSRIDPELILAEDRESLRDAIAVLLVGLSYSRSIGHPFGRHSAGKRWSPAREIHREQEWFD